MKTELKPIKYYVGRQMNFERIGRCVIRRVHDSGTIDVESANGNWFRVTGLPQFEL